MSRPSRPSAFGYSSAASSNHILNNRCKLTIVSAPSREVCYNEPCTTTHICDPQVGSTTQFDRRVHDPRKVFLPDEMTDVEPDRIDHASRKGISIELSGQRHRLYALSLHGVERRGNYVRDCAL